MRPGDMSACAPAGDARRTAGTRIATASAADVRPGRKQAALSPGHLPRLVAVVLAALVVHVLVDGVGYGLVRAARLVLVDHRGALGVVAHARHEIAQPGPAVGGELVAGVPQVVEVEPWQADGLDCVWPTRELVEVLTADRNAHDAGEHERPRV